MSVRAYTWKKRITPSKPKTPYDDPTIVQITISGENQYEPYKKFKLPKVNKSMEPILDSTTGEKTNGVKDNVAYSLNKRETTIVKRYGVEGEPDQFIVANISIDSHSGLINANLLFDPTIDLKEQQLLVPLNVNIHNGNGTAVQEVVLVINAEGNEPDLNFNREMSPPPEERTPDKFIEKVVNAVSVGDYNGYFNNLQNQLDKLNN